MQIIRFIKKLILFLLLASLTISFESCSKFQKSKMQENQRRKKFEKEKEKREKEAEKAYEDAIKRHYAIQDGTTKRKMKENARLSQNHKDNRKECFIKRWFTPKQKKTKSKRNVK